MAEMKVALDQTAGPGALTTTPLYASLTAGTSSAVGIADPTLGSAALLVANGGTSATTTLSAVAGNATGSTLNCGAAFRLCTVVCVGTGTLAGTITIEGSLDNTTFVSTGSTVALTAAATVTATSVDKAFRYYRASLSGASGTGTATAKIMVGS